MAPVVLLASPSTVPFTSTLKVHEALCATLPPDRLITPVPAVAVTVPPQVLLTFGVLDTTSVALPGPPLTGSVSLKATPVRSAAAVVFGLLMVKVSVEVPFNGMLVGLNALLIVGGATTVIEAFEVLPVPALVEVACTLLFLTPAVVPWTSTETVQLAPGARLTPVRLTDEEPPTPVAVPPQVLVRFGVEATTRPAGKLSVKATPFSVKLTLVLLMVKVRLVVPFNGMVAAPKALAIVGGLMTVRLSLEVDCAPVPAAVELIVTLLL